MEWIDGQLEFDLQAFITVIIIDLVMSGDNAIIIGLAAAGGIPLLWVAHRNWRGGQQVCGAAAAAIP